MYDLDDRKLILGSQSPRRAAVLRQLGYDFEQVAATIDEASAQLDDPRELVLALARAKAAVLVPMLGSDAILLTSDVVATCQGRILQKPQTAEEVVEYLDLYSRHPVATVAGLVLTEVGTGRQVEGVDQTLIQFSPFARAEAASLMAGQEVYDWAGAFNVGQPLFKQHLRAMEGELESAMGLPVKLFERLLAELGIEERASL